MDFLVDNTFADELVELSTALEHQEYITFLKDRRAFIKSQQADKALDTLTLWQALAGEQKPTLKPDPRALKWYSSHYHGK